MRAAGMILEPYIWRSYFGAYAEMVRELPKDYREFLVGHKGEISAVYSLHKRLPEEKVEDMRKVYTAALPKLETLAALGQEAGETKVMKALLSSSGLTDEEIGAMNDAELVEALRRGLATKEAAPTAAAGDRKRVIVKAPDADTYLLDGWNVAASLPDGRVVLDPPQLSVATK
jgi:hypothetical protein